MSKEIAVLPIHGMGATPTDFDTRLKAKLRRRLGSSHWEKISWQSVYYQKVLQSNQRAMMNDMRKKGDIDYIKLRQFLLYGFSDAAAMEAKPHEPGSVYEQIQQCIVDSLESVLQEHESKNIPLIIVAHSLGCQVISNYIWDAQRNIAKSGIFRVNASNRIGRVTRRDKFLRLKTLRYLFTSGCNIPIFLAGMPKSQIEPVKVSASGWSFSWHNYYDADDVLGWPLKPINSKYKAAIEVEKQINVGSNLISWLTSQTPLSHNNYWSDNDFCDPIEEAIRSLL